MASYFSSKSGKTIPLYPKAWLSGYSRIFSVEKEGDVGYNALATYSEYTAKGDENCGVTATKDNLTYYFVRLRQQITIYYQLKQSQDAANGHSYYFGYVGYQLRIPETATYGIYSYWTAHKWSNFGGGGNDWQPHARCSGPCGGLFGTSGDTSYHGLGLTYSCSGIGQGCSAYDFNSNGSSISKSTRLYRNPSYSNSSYRAQFNSHYLAGNLKYANWDGSWGSGYYDRSYSCTEYLGYDRNCIVTSCYDRDGRGNWWTSEDYGGSGASCAVERETIVFNSSPIKTWNQSYSPTRFYRRVNTSHYETYTPPGTTVSVTKWVTSYRVDYDSGSNDGKNSFTVTFNL